MNKSELRRLYLERRRSLSAEQLAEASYRITGIFFRSVDLTGFKYLHCFIPIQEYSEINTLPIFQRLWEECPSVTTVAPRIDFDTGEIENVPFGRESGLVDNKWGILEPTNTDRIDSALIDLVIVPLLCFDERGNRVGYGKGYYDRFLTQCRSNCRKIGLSVFPPEKRIEDISAYDIALDLFITPDGSFKPKTAT